MNANELQRTSIKITGVEKKVASNGSVFFNIKDENNRNYKLWMKVKDGSESKAYQALKTMPNEGLGMTVQVAVELQQGEYQGKAVTYRTIKAIGHTLYEKETPVIQVEAPTQDINTLARNILEGNRLQIQQLTAFSEALESIMNQPTSVTVQKIEENNDEGEVDVSNIPF